jgi:hypothetical protein
VRDKSGREKIHLVAALWLAKFFREMDNTRESLIAWTVAEGG